MSGQIDREEFKPMYAQLRKKWKVIGNEFGTFDEVLRSFDRNGDEKISLEEFVQWLVDAGTIYVQTEADWSMIDIVVYFIVAVVFDNCVCSLV